MIDDPRPVEEIKVEKNAWLGRGLAHDKDGKVLFIPFAVAGEIIKGIIRYTKKDYSSVRFIERVETIPESTKPPCRYYSECGGCDYQHITYEKQLEIKDGLREETLVGRYGFDKDIIKTIIPSPKQYGYRNKVRFGVLHSATTFTIKNTRRKIKVRNCLLLDERGQKELDNLKTTEYEKWHDLTIRVGDNGTQVLVEGGKKHGLGKRKVIKLPAVEINYGPRKFQFGDNAFFQVNKEVSEMIFNKVRDEITDGEKVYDLYGGVGVIGIMVCDKAKEVVVVESSEDSAYWGRKNIELNNCKNVSYEHKPVEEFIKENDLSGDTLIIDPSRSGISPEVIEAINNSTAKKLIYISCDLQTFARDLDILKEKFNIKNIEAFDMFPQTYHIENMAILERI